MIYPVTLNGGDPRQQQGIFAKFSGYHSPISRHILCYDHSFPWQPLQPAMVEDKEQEGARCCPFCKGKVLNRFWEKSKRWGFKRRVRYLRGVLTRYINQEKPPDCIKKYLTN